MAHDGHVTGQRGARPVPLRRASARLHGPDHATTSATTSMSTELPVGHVHLGATSTVSITLSLMTACVLASLCCLATCCAASASGPLRVHAQNPRYFADGNGKAVYLTGSHTWANRQERVVAGRGGQASAPNAFARTPQRLGWINSKPIPRSDPLCGLQSSAGINAFWRLPQMNEDRRGRLRGGTLSC